MACGRGFDGSSSATARRGGWNVAAYVPEYTSKSSNESSSELGTALKDAGSNPQRSSNAEKATNLRKRLDKYLFLTNDEEKQKNTAAP
jgi:hypothetical protein